MRKTLAKRNPLPTRRMIDDSGGKIEVADETTGKWIVSAFTDFDRFR